MCSSSLARTSVSADSSRYSLSSRRKSLHVSKGVVPLALEVPGQLLAQLQAGPQEAALHRRYGKAQRFRRFFGRKFIDVPQHENRAIGRLQTLNRRIEDAAEFI